MANAMLDETTTKKKPEPVVLRSAHDYSVVQTALEAHKEGLKKLAEKTTAAGYSRESKVIIADVDAIEHHILPLLRSQREIPLITHKELAKSVSFALSFVREMSDAEFMEILTIENLQREDVHPLEEAQGFADLMKHAGYDVARIADRTGRSHRYVYDRMALLKLTPS
jgi:hypothetical protein